MVKGTIKLDVAYEVHSFCFEMVGFKRIKIGHVIGWNESRIMSNPIFFYLQFKKKIQDKPVRN